MKSFLTWSTKVSEWFVGICIFIIISSMSLQVFCRYVLVRPLLWPEELSKFFFIWSVFFGAFVGVRRKQHISVDVLVEKIPMRFKRFIYLALNLLIIVILGVCTYLGYTLFKFSLASKLPAINIPLGYLYLPVAIAFGLMIISFLDTSLDLIKKIRSGSAIDESGESV